MLRKILSSALIGIGLSPLAAASALSDDAKSATEMQCIDADGIQGYQVESDEVIRFRMDGTHDILTRFKRHCPQLHFHDYISYTPVNGQLCARKDDIVTRSGTPCRISAFSAVPKVPEKEPTTR